MIGRDAVVTIHTIAQTELQQVHIFHILEELLIGGVPGSGNRPESTPLVVGAEQGGPVSTDGCLGKVTVVVVVVGNAEEREHGLVGLSILDFGVALVQGTQEVRHIGISRIRVHLVGFAGIAHGFLAYDGTDRVITSEDIGVGGRVGSGKLENLAGAFVQLVGISGTVGHGAVVVTGIHKEGFHGILGLQIQMLDGSPAQIHGTVNVPGLVPFVIVRGAGAGVFTAVVVHVGNIEPFVVGGGVPRQPPHTGPQRVGAVQGLHRNVGLLCIGQVETYAHLQVVQELVGGVHAALQLIVINAVEHALALLIGERTVEFGTGITAAGAYFILLQGTHAAELVHGIGKLAVQQRPGAVIGAAGVIRVHTGIDDGVTLISEEFLGIHHAETAVALEPVGAEFGAGSKLGLSLTAALGGYQDNAVGGTGAVSGGGSGVLQYGNGLDIVRIQGIQCTSGLFVTGEVHGAGHHRNTVNNPQGSIGCIDGAGTTDTDIGVGTRLTGIGADGNTCQFTGQGILYGSNRGRCQRFTLHGRNGAGHGLPLLRTIGHNHNVFQNLGVFHHHKIDGSAAVHGNRLFLVADDRNSQGTVGGRIEGIFSLKICHSTLGGTLHKDSSSGKRVSAFILHSTAHTDILGKTQGSDKQECGCRKNKLNSFHKQDIS